MTKDTPNSPVPWWSSQCKVPDKYIKNKDTDVSRIVDIHKRGISIKQLEELRDLVETLLDSLDEDYYNPFTNELVTKDNINLYDIDTLIVKPLTAKAKSGDDMDDVDDIDDIDDDGEGDIHMKGNSCSFVELIAPKDCNAQDPTWFVSHWWGTPFLDTLRMLKLHAKERHVDTESEFYWICLFANNQHKLDQVGEQNYMKTPFAKAIMNPTTVGSVVLLTERSAMPFQRSWCVFETFVALTHAAEEKPRQTQTQTQKPSRFKYHQLKFGSTRSNEDDVVYKLDFATIIPESDCETQLNSDQWDRLKGYMEEEEFSACYQYRPNFYNRRCAGILCEQERNKDTKIPIYKDVTDHPFRAVSTLAWFPTHVSQKGTSVSIENAEASRVSDQENIMRWVGNRKTEVNESLRRVFYPFGLYCAATQIGNVANLKEVVQLGEGLFGKKEYVIDIAHQQDVLFDVVKYTEAWTPILLYLLEYGCDPNFKCQREEGKGQTPLDSAFITGSYYHVRTLLKYKADLSLVDEGNIWREQCPLDIIQILDDHDNKQRKKFLCCVDFN